MAAAERHTEIYRLREVEEREIVENEKKRDTGRRETEPCEWGSEERVFENTTREGRKEGREG